MSTVGNGCLRTRTQPNQAALSHEQKVTLTRCALRAHPTLGVVDEVYDSKDYDSVYKTYQIFAGKRSQDFNYRSSESDTRLAEVAEKFLFEKVKKLTPQPRGLLARICKCFCTFLSIVSFRLYQTKEYRVDSTHEHFNARYVPKPGPDLVNTGYGWLNSTGRGFNERRGD